MITTPMVTSGHSILLLCGRVENAARSGLRTNRDIISICGHSSTGTCGSADYPPLSGCACLIVMYEYLPWLNSVNPGRLQGSLLPLICTHIWYMLIITSMSTTRARADGHRTYQHEQQWHLRSSPVLQVSPSHHDREV